MKRSVLILLLLLSAELGFAQINFGPRVALTATRLNLIDNVPDISEGNARVGYMAGLFLRYQPKNWKWYVQSEVLYSEVEGELFISSRSFGYEFQRLDFPILIGRNIGPVRVNAGPVLREELKNRLIRNGGIAFIATRGRQSFGYQVGAGIDVRELVIDVKYESTFGVMADHGGVDGFSENVRLNQWVFAVGFKLF